MVILGLAIISFLGTLLLLEETLPQNKRRSFHLPAISKDYLKLSKSIKFLSYTTIATFPLVSIVIYVANLSIILVNHLGMDLVTCSYYQASTMGTFIIFSLLSAKLIDTKGADYTKNLGGILSIIGTIMLFAVSWLDKTNANMIALSMAFIAAGGATMLGTFGLKALSVFPDMNGTAMAMMTAIRQSLAAGLTILSEVMFDGTIVPVAMIICGYAVVCVMCNVMVCYNEKISSSK